MDYRQKEPIDPVIVDWFTKTLLPVLSWWLSRLFSGVLGYRLTVVLLHPTATYSDRVADTWVKINQPSSCAEILSFQTASGRRRGRKKLRKLLRPLLREMTRSQEFLLFKRRFQEKLDSLKKTFDNKIPVEIVPKARIEIDIAKLEERKDEPFTVYSPDDILSAFPVGSTLADDNLRKRIASEVDGYPETMRSLLWEASYDWNLIRQVRERIREYSEIWEILGFDSNNEPNLEAVMDWALDFGLGEANEGKLMYLARWFVDRILVSQFIPYPYSEKHFTSLEKPIGDDLTLKDTVADGRAQDFVDDVETVKADTPWAQPTDLSQAEGREAIIEALARKGISYNELTPKEWAKIFEKFDLIRKGYEFSSKTGVSISSFYGKDAHAEEQKWSRIKKKIRKLSE